jgi:Cytochrome P460
MIRSYSCGALVLMAACALLSSSMKARAQQPADTPRFGADNELARPENYREWIYLSSGLGMSYSAGAGTNPNPPFDNVFVTPSAYRSFLQSGAWPEKTMFVLELRSSGSEASINRQGRFQQQVLGIEVEVKDSSRFQGKWAFYEFGRAASAKPTPTTASCYSCHAQNGAVDNTFVQFYPTLAETARQKGTFKESTSVPRQ